MGNGKIIEMTPNTVTRFLTE